MKLEGTLDLLTYKISHTFLMSAKFKLTVFFILFPKKIVKQIIGISPARHGGKFCNKSPTFVEISGKTRVRKQTVLRRHISIAQITMTTITEQLAHDAYRYKPLGGDASSPAQLLSNLFIYSSNSHLTIFQFLSWFLLIL